MNVKRPRFHENGIGMMRDMNSTISKTRRANTYETIVSTRLCMSWAVF